MVAGLGCLEEWHSFALYADQQTVGGFLQRRCNGWRMFSKRPGCVKVAIGKRKADVRRCFLCPAVAVCLYASEISLNNE
jgi:hypothetical protein